MTADRDRQRTRLAIAAWAIVAFAFAIHRVPFDDEWFSLTLARDTTWPQFWSALATDVHPPYVALVDRAAFAITRRFWGISLAHTLVSAAAIALVAASARRVGLRGWACAMGALHPIVFMYGGAARWYAFAFLADALRLWALVRWRAARLEGRDERDDRRAAIAFAAGCAIGVASGYVECALVAIDSIVLLSTTRARRHAIVFVAASAIVPVASLVLWPPWIAHLAAARAVGAARLAGNGVATFIGLGVLGEAHLPPPWTALAIVAIPGLVAIVAARRARAWIVQLAPVTVGWCLCAALGFWHPRYALIVWMSLGALVVDGAVASFVARRARVITALSVAYFSLADALTASERAFLKGDLDRLPSEACAPIFADAPDVLVVPYAHLAREIDAVCDVSKPLLTTGWIAHADPSESAFVAALRDAIAKPSRVTLVTIGAGGSALDGTQRRARTIVEARCHSVSTEDAVEDRYATLKPWQRTDAGAKVHRLRIERFACP